MDRSEAKRVLQALRPDDLTSSEPSVIQALILVESDRELKAWWEAEKSFDQKVAAKLAQVPVPDDLRETILAERSIEPFIPQPLFPYWLAAAAVLALLCVAGTSLRTAASKGPLALADYADDILPLVYHDVPALGMTSADHDRIAAWLKERNAPTGTMPARMTDLPPVGCQKFVIHGHTVSLICFALEHGGLAHLFIIDQKALSDPPALDAPEIRQIQGWETASWSDGRMSYLLATHSGVDALKQLL